MSAEWPANQVHRALTQVQPERSQVGSRTNVPHLRGVHSPCWWHGRSAGMKWPMRRPLHSKVTLTLTTGRGSQTFPKWTSLCSKASPRKKKRKTSEVREARLATLFTYWIRLLSVWSHTSGNQDKPGYKHHFQNVINLAETLDINREFYCICN